MRGYYEPFVRGLVGRVVEAGSAPYTFLVGEFGVLTMTVTYLIGVILPLVAGFYLLMSVLEDSGYYHGSPLSPTARSPRSVSMAER